MRGLLRLVVVLFTVVSLLLVAAVGVSASSGKAGTDTLKNSVASLFSGHFDQAAAHHQGNGNGNNEGNGNGNGNGGGGDKCKPKHNEKEHEATGDHDNDDNCGRRDKG